MKLNEIISTSAFDKSDEITASLTDNERLELKEAIKIFCTPLRTKRTESEQALASTGQSIELENGISAVLWGDSADVLLVHGWCGRGTQMSPMVAPLREKNLGVLTIDCWGHGNSPGELSHGIKFAESIMQAAVECGPFKSAIGHSVGAAAIVIALHRGLELEKAVLLAPPSIHAVLRKFATARGYDERMVRGFIAEMEINAGAPLHEVDSILLAQKITTPTLVIHDVNDRDVPFEHGAQFVKNCSTATLHQTENLGHRRIIKADEVIQKSVDFSSQ